MSKTIKLYRHGETEWNKEGRLQGWLDSPLTTRGEQQAMPQLPVEVVFTSDLGRAVDTAKRLFPRQAILRDKRLREIYLGEWQGHLVRDLQTQAPYQCYSETPAQFKPTSQESFVEVTARMQQFFEELVQRPEQQIAVVSHGVAIACLIAVIEGRSLEELWSHGLIEGGQCYTLTYTVDRWRVCVTV